MSTDSCSRGHLRALEDYLKFLPNGPTFEWVPPVMPSGMIASNDPEERPRPAPVPPMLARTLRRAPAFPTRHYPYRRLAAAEGASIAAAPVFTDVHPFPGVINRFILGRDTEVRAMTDEEAAQTLRDPFGALLLRRGKFPLTLRAILAELAAFDQQPEGIPKQQAFFVADGGQIAWTPETAGLARQLRLVLARHRGGDAELLVSTASPFDSEEVFLQLLAWDPDNLAFNFYERRGGAWIWAGSSWDALAPDTRGHGPFDSHVNGGLVMKELKVPWMHWNSMAITIEPSALAPDDPLRKDPLFVDRDGAESLEKLVRGGLTRWTNARFKRCVTGDTLTRAPQFFRQVLATTTVNLTSSPQVSRTVAAGQPLRLPRTFFLHVDALLNELNLGIAFPPPKVDGALYLDCLKRYAVELRDEAFSVPGDTFFAFPVPEPAFEDVIVLRELLARQFLTRRMAVTLLMVDFPNAVFSPRREQLLAYVPDEVTAADGDGSFQSGFVKAIRAAAGSLRQDAPEREFLELWALADDAWEPACVARVNAYLETVGARLADATGAGYDAFFRLAESRRRNFRHRPLSEFSLTLPFTNIPADDPPLEMTAAAEVRPRIASPKSFILSPTNHSTSPTSVMEQFDPPGFLEDLNPSQRAQWSDWISSQLDAVAAGDPDSFDFDAPRPRFFNPLKNPPAADAVERDIRWNAFPRIVQLDAASDAERWQTADASRDVQDEYCEWSVTRDPTSHKITRVTFTSEAPEYWQFLAAANFPLVVQLYQQHVNSRVRDQDLRDSAGRYNPRNRWNSSTTLGAMHLIQRNNTLGAEIELAAGASNVREVAGRVLTGEAELIACGNYGAVERHSDPHIGAEVNALARANAAITLANPIGLCIDGLNVAGWATPDGSDPLAFWRVTRGTPQKALRAVYEVPAEKGFVIGDIKINGQRIDFGAQITDSVTIKLTGLATRLGQVQEPPLMGCKRTHQARAVGAAARGVGEALDYRDLFPHR